MPAISDPGYRLIRACIDRDLDVEVLPGPSSIPVALVASGLPSDRWCFEGYLPRRAGELERVLQSAETVIAFESPRRLPDSLAALSALAPERPAAVCRELSKLHEEITRGTLSELARRFRGEQRGEIIVVIGPARTRGADRDPDITMAVDALRRLVQAGARPRAAAEWSPRSPGRGPTTSTGRSRGASRASRAAAGARRASRISRFPGAMRWLITIPAVFALGGAVGCAEEEKTVSDDEIIQSLNLERAEDAPVYEIGGDSFCQVEEELLNDAAEVEQAEKDKNALVVADSTDVVGIQVVTPFDPRCEEEARKALNRLGKEDEG